MSNGRTRRTLGHAAAPVQAQQLVAAGHQLDRHACGARLSRFCRDVESGAHDLDRISPDRHRLAANGGSVTAALTQGRRAPTSPAKAWRVVPRRDRAYIARVHTGAPNMLRELVIRAVSCAIALVSLAALAASPCFARPPLEDVSIGVITFGRGDEVHQYFGHNAFVVTGLAREPAVFNYGMFSFGSGVVSQFLMGRLRFWLGTTPLGATVASYASAQRDVRILDLDLTAPERAAVVERLLHDARPENRYYLYDHYRDNCSTRVRDVLDRALHGQLRKQWSHVARFTLREETRRYTERDPLTQWGMMLALDGSVDRPQLVWDDAFLPLELEALLQRAVRDDPSDGRQTPLVTRTRTLYSAPRQRPLMAAPSRHAPMCFAIGFALALVFVLLGEAARAGIRGARSALLGLSAAYGVVAGLLGVLLFHLAVFSDHQVAHKNLNLLLANPLTLVAGVLGLIGLFAGSVTRAWAYLWALHALLLAALGVALVWVVQDVSQPAALLAPVHLALAVASLRFYLASSGATVMPSRNVVDVDAFET